MGAEQRQRELVCSFYSRPGRLRWRHDFLAASPHVPTPPAPPRSSRFAPALTPSRQQSIAGPSAGKLDLFFCLFFLLLLLLQLNFKLDLTLQSFRLL
eukprot:81326-Pleurochrysis_carterae.AAC.1